MAKKTNAAPVLKAPPKRKLVHPTIDRYADRIGYDPVNPYEYDFVIWKIREFFRQLRFVNAYVQHRFSILSACEDPDTIAQLVYAGYAIPMRQTGQMDLEFELLTRMKDCAGLYCETHSSRQEPDPEPGRHDLSFPMFEFEFPKTITGLVETEMALLEYLGFGNRSTYHIISYAEAASRYGVTTLKSEHEAMLWQDFGPVVFLVNFPEHTSPFFNMKRDGDTANKVDVILYGIETIGSAERSIDPEDMRGRFHAISDGNYAKRLFGSFGKNRVTGELNDFLSLPFFPRCGGGIGITRMIRALKLAGQLETENSK